MRMLALAKAEMQRLMAMEEETLHALIRRMSPEDLLRLDAMFELWAHHGQLPPKDGGWRTWLMMAGRGFGKTRAGAEWVHQIAIGVPNRRIALVAATMDEARQVMVDGVSGLIAVAKRRGVTLKYEAGQGILRWPNGSQARLFSGENPDGLRGPEHHIAWCDELAKWRRAEETWDNLQLGLRLGDRARALVTTTPRPIALLERLRGEATTVETGGRTCDNVSLPDSFVDVMTSFYGGSRLGRQELDGELLSEAEGSLFPRRLIERSRIDKAADYERVVVAIDPPASAHGGSDLCGIGEAGLKDGVVTILADASAKGLSPQGWGKRAIEVARIWGAGQIVAEANQGGNMISHVLQAAGSDEAGLTIKLVHARLGKTQRAEPVAAWMAAGKVRIAGRLPELEAQLTGMQAGGRYQGPDRSPDRADAAIWAVQALFETRSGVPRVSRV